MASFDAIAGSYTTYLAAQMWRDDIWLNMMAESFKGIDVERNYLTKNGSWTSRTTSIQRYAKVDIYA